MFTQPNYASRGFHLKINAPGNTNHTMLYTLIFKIHSLELQVEFFLTCNSYWRFFSREIYVGHICVCTCISKWAKVKNWRGYKKVPSAFVKVTSTLQHDCCIVRVYGILLLQHENVSCKSRDFFGHTLQVSSALIEEKITMDCYNTFQNHQRWHCL